MLDNYRNMINDALDSVDQETLKQIYNSVALFSEMPVFVFGNGGSAAIAEHWVCDHLKGITCDTNLSPEVRSLSSNIPLITAIANDIGYDEVFSKQIEWSNESIAVALAISSSGSSPNIVKGLKSAKSKIWPTIAIVGFNGGEVVKQNLADYIIHIKANNYGVVEDCSQIIMHTIIQEVRKNYSIKGLKNLKL